ncbi:hypothetical protein FA10DRAFT_268056 [Acaromyces ingoldii]|uniref:Chitin synthase n=1 Tax=Acaromyces ingoldii TaxID=215250 RepID=A0A316YL28_9BASI|nr:hypothetical protein FA10DRAFT_268056 [Acaromyces ingoldii]PWN89514.1 hypothetical protein FA10DRAFT_268056 [Acaromyces ingoldii]
MAYRGQDHVVHVHDGDVDDERGLSPIGAGHQGQLSESFYHEAAAALGNINADGDGSRQPAASAHAAGLNAYLPTLLQSPYDTASSPLSQQQDPAPSYTSPAGYDYARGYVQPGADDEEEAGVYGYEDEDQNGKPYQGYGQQDYAQYEEEERQFGNFAAEGYEQSPYGYEGEERRSSQETYLGTGEDDVAGPSEKEAIMYGSDTMHFGPAPARGAQLRRHKTKKNVKLTQGNLVLDCPVPTKLQSFLSRRGDDEFMQMRYTAATCEPDDFSQSNFSLRPALLNRHTEIFIAITLYNEDEVLFTRTLHGVMKNIAHLCSRHKSRTWGPEGWRKVVVAIIADGRKKIHPRVLDVLASLGIYQEGVAKNSVNGKAVEAHIYEYTTQLSIDSNLQFKGAERGLVPMQVIFCLKESNKKKINSHRWFFNAFGPIIQPNVCVLIDAGTRPENKSIYHLWKTFDLNSNVAGACGEITADVKGKWGLGPALLNPLVAAQNFEYKISNILDKTTESVFGYISVLPGAFSAYRYIALQNNELGQGPLASYFKGETMHGAEADVFTSNMYLAEDRILCFELAAKRQEGWVLRYVKSARGVTDVPDRLPEFISQRRRWLNGSFFAGVYALTHTTQFLSSGHGVWRKAMLLVESLYSFINLAFAWFSLANFYIFFRILSQSLEAPSFHLGKGIAVWNTVVQYIYLGTTISCFILSLGNRPQGSRWKYFLVSCIYAALTLFMMIAAVLCLVQAVKHADHDSIYAQMIVSVLATYGVYLLSSFIALDPLHLVTSFFQYLLFVPTMVNLVSCYSFCNLHDFSWGTKGATAEQNDLGIVVSSGQGIVEVTLPTNQADIDSLYDQSLHNLRTRPMLFKGEEKREEKEARRMDYYRNIRTNVLLAWCLSNGVLAALILSGDTRGTFEPGSGTTRSKIYMLLVLVFVGALSCIRFIGSTAFMVHRAVVG